jgi:hypothetical protein
MTPRAQGSGLTMSQLAIVQPRPDALRTPTPAALAPRDLPERITRAASKQAYYTVRFLADRERQRDAYRAYAYFRWVDDSLDQSDWARPARLAFVARQQTLVERGYQGGCSGAWPADLTAEERMLIDLMRSDHAAESGLRSYIHNMMAVMAFDAERRGKVISERELEEYALRLATAVTDALHHFIDHTHTPPPSPARYLPAMGAHITHMLRDTWEDVAMGYYNVPGELLAASGIGPADITSAPYRAWAQSRVRLARSYFAAGADYLAQVEGVRCRLAGYAYMARFVGVLDAIEREDYLLRPAYPERTRLDYGLRMAGSACANAVLRSAR